MKMTRGEFFPSSYRALTLGFPSICELLVIILPYDVMAVDLQSASLALVQ
jgi:hypothetical protein